MPLLYSDTLKTNIILIVIFDVIGYYKQSGSSRNLSQNSAYTQFQFLSVCLFQLKHTTHLNFWRREELALM